MVRLRLTKGNSLSSIKELDLARAMAILGMAIVNFKVATGTGRGNQLLFSLTAIFEG